MLHDTKTCYRIHETDGGVMVKVVLVDMVGGEVLVVVDRAGNLVSG